MSTNGQITFIAGGHAKRSYNHSDSYPSGLGLNVLEWLRDMVALEQDDAVRRAIKDLVVAGDDPGCAPPTAEQEQALAEYKDENVGSPDEHWYRLLRLTQGEPAKILRSGYCYDQNPGIEGGDEYLNYVVDADQRTFSIRGRSWSWGQLPDSTEFLTALKEEES